MALTDKEDERLRAVESKGDQFQGAVLLGKWLVGLVAAVLLATLANFLWTFLDVRLVVAKHEERIANTKDQAARDLADIKEAIAKSEARHTWMLDRLTRSGGGYYGGYTAVPPPKKPYREYVGKLVSISKDTVVVEKIEGKGTIRYTFPVAEKVTVRVDEKSAQLADLRLGILVRITVFETGKVEVIETVDEDDELPPFPRKIPPPAPMPAPKKTMLEDGPERRPLPG